MADFAPADDAAGTSSWWPAALILAAGSPALFLSYLPMTDLPQHLAVASILLHWGDPHFGFEEYFELALTRSPYLLPYAVVIALAQFMPIAIAMRILVFASVVAYPLGLLAVLRSTGRAGVLALLALPLMYNRAFFWGFVNFNLALGMSLLAIAWLERERQGALSKLGLAALCAAIPLTHAYGIALVGGYVFLWLVVGERRKLIERAAPLLPLVVGGGAWLAMGWQADIGGNVRFDSLFARMRGFAHAILGNYTNPSDELLFSLTLVATGFFCAAAFPWNAARWRALDRPARVALLYAGLNYSLYWVLPTHTNAVYFIHFRHGLLAVALLPLFASSAPLVQRPRLARALLAAVVLATAAIHGTHLVRFDREARAFDDVIAELPDRPRVYLLAWDSHGEVVRTRPYHHFHAYILAQRGGVISHSFPGMFWNIPVRLREDAGLPRSPAESQWSPESFDGDADGSFYDWVLVRRPQKRDEDTAALENFPYELVYTNPPWELHARRAPAAPETGGTPP